MEVILLERVENLGGIGDVVKVRDGFARNYLLPRHKALRATEESRKKFEVQRADIEARNADARAKAEAEGAKLDGQTFVLLRQAGESGHLYGSVSARDVADVAAADKFTIERHAIVLDKPIKALGMHPLRVRLHPEVSVTITLNVARSQDEAERQARGENVIAAAAADERALADEQAKEIAAAAAANEFVPRED
ncbi:MAG TPA: 50S ribosomal protein L9 [Caulobacterales bacterium]|jgi:large subunit ribosomal protein L9|nr:50S ribosomal protein L9 [Caulobacterales bacterium]